MSENAKTGLVMEGGAMRGLFTAGVIDVLMENNIYTDGAVGVSAGACFGCNYISKQIGRVLRYNLRFCRDPRFSGLRSLIKTGNLYGADFCYREIPDELDLFDYETCLKSKTEFHMVATDCNTGKPLYYVCDDDKERNMEYMRASASMPIVSQIVKIDGYELLDGGITDAIPLKYFQEAGFEKNIVILTQPRGYTKAPELLTPVISVLYRKYPEFCKAMGRRHIMYNQQLKHVAREEHRGTTLVIAPPCNLPAGKVEHDPDVLQKTYDIGREAALECLDKIKEFMGIKED